MTDSDKSSLNLEQQLKVLGDTALQEAEAELDAKLETIIATAIEGAVKDGPTVSMNWDFFNGLTDTIREERKLTQFLGVGLRGVLPYAEQEVASIYEVARRDSDDVARQEAYVGSRAITRAQAALNRLEVTDLTIKNISDDTFDDNFEVKFDDEEE